MKKTKRLLALLLTMVLMLSGIPLNAFAEDGSVSLTNEYYDVDENGEVTGTGQGNAERTVPDTGSGASVTYSKTAAAMSNDNEFEITLNVETMEDLAEIETTEPVSVVLVLDVSHNMDWMIEPAAGGRVAVMPGMSEWDVSGTCWTQLKEKAKIFIEELLAANPENQVSITIFTGIIWSGAGLAKLWNPTVHATICDWTSDADEAIDSFYGYEYASAEAPYALNGYDNAYRDYNDSLSASVFNLGSEAGRPATSYGGSINGQAAFQSAREKLATDDSGNGQYVIIMGPAAVEDSYDMNIGVYPNSLAKVTPANADAIEEAAALKSEYQECTIYTIGVTDFSGGAYDELAALLPTNNSAVSAYYPVDNAGDLEIALNTISSEVYTTSHAWTVTDPMPDYVTFNGVTAHTADDCWEFEDDTLAWDLTKCTPTETMVGGKTVYTYTLTYTVTVAPTDLAEGTYYPTNLKTTLDYAFADPATGKVGETQTAEFLVPTVKVNETPIPTYKVTYDANGGTGSYEDTGLAEDSEYTIKSLKATGIARDGYTFLGWSAAENGSVDYGPGDVIIIEDNVILYAQWKADPIPAETYTVTYDPNGGVGTAYSVTEEVGNEHSVLANTNNNLRFTKEGYALIGWSTDSSATSADYTSGEMIGSNAVDGEEIILYAVWSELQPLIDYYVIYYPNGGTGNPYEDTGLAEDSIYTVKNLTTTGISRAGYTFLGWSTSENGIVAYNPGDTTTIMGNMLLYAQWEKIPDSDPTYTVIYDPNGGTGDYADADLASGSKYTVKSLKTTRITRDGYTFTGWNTEADGSGLDYEAGDTLTIDGDVTLYAQWEKDPEGYSAEYTFESDDGTSLPKAVWALLPNDNTDYADGETAYAIAPVQNIVYVTGGTWTFKGWDEDSREIDGSDVLFTGTWTFEVTVPDGSTYNVGYTFVSDDGRSLPSAVLALLPSDDIDYADGTGITAPDLSGTEVVTAGGKWTFVEWDEDTKTIDGDNVIFNGTWTFTENEPDASTYNVGYTFVSDSSRSIPQAVWDQLPSDDTDYEDGATIDVIDPAELTVYVTGGIWTFTGWDENSKTIDGDDVLFTGTWTYTKDEPETPTYNAGYTFVSDSGKSIPQAVWDQLPSDMADYNDGDTVNVIASAETTVCVTGGTWTFVEWDTDSKEIDGDDVVFTGTWKYTTDGPEAPTYNAGYTFVSDRGKSIPQAVWDQLPSDMADYNDGDTVNVIAPAETTVYVTGGTWTFVEWDADSREIDGDDVVFTGTWKYTADEPETSVYNAGYTFVSDSGRSIPQAVWDQLPNDTADYADGDTVNAIAPAETTVYVTGGTWTFVEWDADSREIDSDDVVFTGTWKYTADGPEASAYNVGYTFVSDSGKSIPQAVWDQLPSDTADYNDGETVNAITPAKTTVKVTGGTWTFTGWDADSRTIEGDDVIFTGTWKYTADEPTSPAYTVDYDANGGSGSHADENLASGSDYKILTLPGTGITRDGYTFKGWNTKADGSGTSYAPGDTITITEDMTLYAQWEKTSSGSTTTPGKTGSGTTSPGKSGTTTSSPKTGDTSNMTLWIPLLFVSLAGVISLLVAARRRKQYKAKH